MLGHNFNAVIGNLHFKKQFKLFFFSLSFLSYLLPFFHLLNFSFSDSQSLPLLEFFGWLKKQHIAEVSFKLIKMK
jgi:hypothetical protein